MLLRWYSVSYIWLLLCMVIAASELRIALLMSRVLFGVTVCATAASSFQVEDCLCVGIACVYMVILYYGYCSIWLMMLPG